LGRSALCECRREKPAHDAGAHSRFTRLFARISEDTRLKSGSIWLDRFERLANIRGNSLEELLDSIEVPRQLVLDQCGSANGPTVSLLQKISDVFEITVDDLVEDRYDTEWVKNPSLFPAFQAEEGSRLRTSLAVIRWIENHYGRRPVRSLMRALRIPQQSLRNPDQPVRLRMLCTLLRAARVRGLADSSVFEMGLGAVDIGENLEIHAKLSQYRNPRRLYECFFTEIIGQFESNYDYRIEKSDSKSVTLRITPREIRIQENGRDVSTDRTLSIYRWGVTAGLLKAIDRLAASASPLRLIDEDSGSELVQFDWDNSNHAAILMPRRRSRPSWSPSAP
jgi:hypothetical protein